VDAREELTNKVRSYGSLVYKWDRATLARFVRYVAAQPETHALASAFTNPEEFPGETHPVIEVSSGGPSLYILGWRRGGETPIHDHVESAVAVHALAGEVVEEAFLAPRLLSEPGECVECTSISRPLRAGTTVTLPPSYIHRVGNHLGEVAVTVHAYYPPLARMGYYREILHPDGEGLESTGQWAEEVS
jgi:hypothetical protein